MNPVEKYLVLLLFDRCYFLLNFLCRGASFLFFLKQLCLGYWKSCFCLSIEIWKYMYPNFCDITWRPAMCEVCYFAVNTILQSLMTDIYHFQIPLVYFHHWSSRSGHHNFPPFLRDRLLIWSLWDLENKSYVPCALFSRERLKPV